MKFSVFFTLIVCSLAYNIVSLNGDWNIVNKNGTINISGAVPGSVHTALMEAKIIGDPYYRDNDYVYTWVGKDYWTYSRKFEFNEKIADQAIYLDAEGIDTIADIIVNDVTIGHVDNMYRRWWFDLRSIIKEGTNTITVKFDNSYEYANLKSRQYPYDPRDTTSYAPFKDAHRAFIRKTQSDFGWDWGPSFVPVGIHRDIQIVTFTDAYIRDISIQTFEEKSSWRLENDVILLCKAGTSSTVKLALENGATASQDFTCEKDGEKIVRVTMSVTDVERWQPINMGDSQKLYRLDSYINDQKQKSIKIGFRTIKMVTDPINSSETSFYFMVNDEPVFIKGSNFIPMDAFDTRVSDEEMKMIIDSAVKGNHNSIRVWGGGLYQRDSFYEYCDEKGILVWEEFMFACSLYPRDKAFLENVRQEIIDNVHRLSYHPSIFLWSGNNENQNPAQQFTQTLLDYIQLYDETIRKTLQTIDLSRPYWPASPSNGYIVADLENDLFIQRFGSEGDSNHGDTHRYDYFSLCTDVHTYPKPKFASEFGFHSLPSYYTWREAIDESDMDIKSDIVLKRNHHMDNNDQMINMMKNFFPAPTGNNTVEKFRNNILQSQIMQGYCISYEAEHYRRGRTEYHTMGTMYWQLNDIWQAPTWASVEWHNMRWKALHYMMKDTYENVIPSVYTDDDTMVFYIISDTYAGPASINVTAYTWDGEFISNNVYSGKVERGSAQMIYQIKQSLFCEKDIDQYLVKYTLHYGSQETKPRYYLPNINKGLFNKIKLSNPHMNIDSKTVVSDTEIQYVLSCKSVAAHVWLESEVAGIYSDNAFMCIPGEPVTITFTSYKPMTQEEKDAPLEIRSIYDTYN